MFARRLRLSRHAIAEVSSSSDSKRATSEHFSAVCAQNDGARADADDRAAGFAGCAVVVSKKVAKTSVDRHLLKRRINATLGEWCQASYALIIYARPGSATLSHSAIVNELATLLPRIGAYRTM